VSQKTVACFVFYNLKKLEPILIILTYYIPIFLAAESMHRFPPLLIFTDRTLQFIWVIENDAFSRYQVKINMLFNKDRILIRNLYLLKGYIV